MKYVWHRPPGRPAAARREPGTRESPREVSMSARILAVLLPLLLLGGCAWDDGCPPGSRRESTHELGASPRRVEQINSTGTTR
jgi:hypothetical protein